MPWFIIIIALLTGSVIGQFGYGAGVMLILAAAVLWAGDALNLWINTGQAVFVVRIFSATGAVAIGTHLFIAFMRKRRTAREAD